MLIYLICIIFVSSISQEVAAGPKFPDYIKQCKLDDTLSKCLTENFEAARPHVLNGIPDLFIPPLNPLHLLDLKLETPQFMFHIVSLDLTGLENYEVEFLEINMSDLTLTLKLIIPFIEATGEYKMKGSIILLTLEGSGHAFANLTQIESILTMQGVKEIKNGKEHVNFKDSSMDMNVVGPNYLYFGNLFGSNEGLSETMNAVINQNNGDFISELFPLLEQATVGIAKRAIRLLMSKYPVDELFIK